MLNMHKMDKQESSIVVFYACRNAFWMRIHSKRGETTPKRNCYFPPYPNCDISTSSYLYTHKYIAHESYNNDNKLKFCYRIERQRKNEGKPQ